jgi:hypothetical protein
MVDSFDEIKKYLPQYLSSESQKTLFSEIDTFVSNGHCDNMYSSKFQRNEIVLQGDVLHDFDFVFLPNRNFNKSAGMVLTNTCDIDPANNRLLPIQICYAPIMRLGAYISRLEKENINGDKIKLHIENIKKQRYTHILYLPKHSQGPSEDAIVMLDRICNCDTLEIDRANVPNQRMLSLNNFGFYLFLMKLSINFTRIREKVDRVTGDIY